MVTVGTMAQATSVKSGETAGTPPVAATTETGGEQGGCSVAARGGVASPSTVLGLALLALVVRRRGRRYPPRASDKNAG